MQSRSGLAAATAANTWARLNSTRLPSSRDRRATVKPGPGYNASGVGPAVSLGSCATDTRPDTADTSPSATVRPRAYGTVTTPSASSDSPTDSPRMHRFALSRFAVRQPRDPRQAGGRRAHGAGAPGAGDAAGSDHRVRRDERRHPAGTIVRPARWPTSNSMYAALAESGATVVTTTFPNVAQFLPLGRLVSGRLARINDAITGGRRPIRLPARRPLQRGLDARFGHLGRRPRPRVHQGPHPVRRRGRRGSQFAWQQP